MAGLVDYAGPTGRVRLLPHTTTADLWTFVETLRLRGVTVELPESCPSQTLRDILDTKHGLRSLVVELGLAGSTCRVADGRTCHSRAEATVAVTEFLAEGRPCIAKADRGEASVGLLIFRPGDDPEHIRRSLTEGTFYGDDPIVVEEYVDGDDVVFPSVEYIVPEEPAAEPVLTHVCEMLFDGPTRLRGNATGPSLVTEKWYENLVSGSLVIARELQRRGYRGHFGIDAVARESGEVFLLDLNPRRTGSTHVHDFGSGFFGANYAEHTAVGNFDFYGLEAGISLEAVLDLLGPLVRAPGSAPTGVVPCELTGLEAGRLSCMIFAPSMDGFHALVEQVRGRIQHAGHDTRAESP
ncbi:hypothetical protein GCM10012275_37590 [Longimycelium tulufanense]|uniref:ATP-grasp domain-containing protein n=2 Tax=Longimycelium tulufanense TaxID=907463 RepID=A0A8J3CHS6_9PSEU|nr:hypothetical protein GCM10012275_37590 [Longimycelium tulufanense]